MALISQRASDLTGKVSKEDDFCLVVIRRHPALDAPRQFDALKSEVAHLTASADVVEVDIKDNGDVRSLVIPRAEFDALAKDITSVLNAARPTRGREKGRRL